MEQTHLIIAFYIFTEIEDPHLEVKKHKEFLKDLDIRCRIYLSPQGINCQLSGVEKDAICYMNWLKSDKRFENIEFKIDPYNEHVLPKQTVKFRNQLAALDRFPDINNQGEHTPPEKWHKMLELMDEDTVLIDVRNDYESKIGHFEGAQLPQLKTFREFSDYAKELREEKDPKKTKVMMYCTGGIRCELYSAYLKEEGFENVYQLDGGIINYGYKMGGDRWKGKLFVFDDRLSVSISQQSEPEIISECQFCNAPSDVYLNCANMDCNELFLSCPECAEKFEGCCSEECTKVPRKRPFEKTDRPKPFRKWYNYLKNKKEICR